MNAEDIAKGCGGAVRQSNKSWMTRCPAHDDRNPSLCITDGQDHRILVHCFAGCTQAAVIDALRGRGLWPAPQPPSHAQRAYAAVPSGCTLLAYAEAKRLPLARLREFGLGDVTFAGAPAVRMPYWDAAGNATAIRFRTALVKADPDNRFRWQKGARTSLYGLWRLQPGPFVVLVEGESDCHTLWFHGVPAVGLPGAGNWREDRDAPHLEGFTTIYVVIEPDDAGTGLKNKLAQSGLQPRMRVISLGGYKDPSGLHLDDEGAFGQRWQEALDQSVPLSGTPQPAPEDRFDAVLDGLIERAVHDPGAPFEPPVVEALARLRSGNPPEFQRIRAALRAAKVRVSDLDRTVAASPGSSSSDEPSQADVLVGIASATAELFHAPDTTAYADVMVEDHRETWAVRSKGFRRRLVHGFFTRIKKAPNSEALGAALNTLEASAICESPCREVFVRVVAEEERIYLDLADPGWRAVEVDATGWRIVVEPPVRFRREPGMASLPEPQRGGSINELRPFLNVRGEDAFVLTVAWLLAALRGRGPYPVLAVSGEQGSAKSTFSKIVRSLVDPSSMPLRSLPREDRDLFIAVNNAHIIAFDNVSGLPYWLSDALCRLSTGGGFATRELYSDRSEVLFEGMRPVLRNGITDSATRGDLADRSITLILEAIPETARQLEGDLLAKFEAARPRLLGALLDALAHGLKSLPSMRLDRLPRMADFALWITACEGKLWAAKTFAAAYADNRDEAVDLVIESDTVALAIQSLLATTGTWTGTATQLLNELSNHVSEAERRAKSWPTKANTLSGRLRRAAPALRRTGIAIAFDREGHGRQRTIEITCTVTADADAVPPAALATVRQTVPANQLTYKNKDDADADFPHLPHAAAISELPKPAALPSPAEKEGAVSSAPLGQNHNLLKTNVVAAPLARTVDADAHTVADARPSASAGSRQHGDFSSPRCPEETVEVPAHVAPLRWHDSIPELGDE